MRGRLLPPAGPMVGRLAATCLVLEALLVLFAVLAATGLSDLPRSLIWGAGGALAVACLLAAGLVRRPGGLLLGTLLQVLLVATGFWVPAMFFLAPLFVALWFWFLYLGARVDGARAAAAGADHPS